MKSIKLFNLQNGHYYAINEPYNFVRQGEEWFYIGLNGRIGIKKRMIENMIEVEGVYSEDCYQDAFK